MKADINDFSYEIEDGKVVLTGYMGSLGSIKMPDKIVEKVVYRIEKYAFYKNEVLVNVILPDG